jgi:molecular chaperone DnaK
MADPVAAMKLKQAATECKTTLSDAELATVQLPLILGDIIIDRTVTRDEFENLIRPLVSSTGEQIGDALSEAGIAAADLQRVLLVGGTTRIPLVRRYVAQKLGAIPNVADAPELMVVRGAAAQAGIIDGVISEDRGVVLTDVCPFSLGTRVVTPYGYAVDRLIRKNVTIPYEYSKVYTAMHEYQLAINVEIYQGESKHPQENTQIGSLLLDKLPRRKNERAKAEVTFAYDTNGLLNVTARALGNDRTTSTVIDINNSDIPLRAPVKLSEWERAGNASKYRPLLRKTQKILDEYAGSQFFIGKCLYDIQNYCDELKAALIVEDLARVEKHAGLIKEFLDGWDE